MEGNNYPDEVARQWKAERDRYRAALESIAGVHDPRPNGGCGSVEARADQAGVFERIAREALSNQVSQLLCPLHGKPGCACG